MSRNPSNEDFEKESLTSNDPNGAIGKVFEKIINSVNKTLKDVTTLEVKTFLVDDTVKIQELIDAEKIKIKKDGSGAPVGFLIGYTRIDADGDITEILHGNPNSPPKKELLSIHQQNREVGVESWNRFFKNMITVTAAVYSLVTQTKEGAEIIKALRDEIKPIGRQ